MDGLSKLRHFILCHTSRDALRLAEWFLSEVVRLHGLPLRIISARVPQFASTFWPQVCRRLGIDRRMSTAFHPQTDGQTEQMNASMEQYLWSIRDDLRVADKVYLKRGCLVSEDLLFFSLYSFSCIPEQVRLWTFPDSCLVLIPSIRTLKRLVPNAISHYCYQYHLHPTPPVAVWSLKSWITRGSFLEEIITCSHEVFKDFESDIALRIWYRGNPMQ